MLKKDHMNFSWEKNVHLKKLRDHFTAPAPTVSHQPVTTYLDPPSPLRPSLGCLVFEQLQLG